jgi:hypothetical protein
VLEAGATSRLPVAVLGAAGTAAVAVALLLPYALVAGLALLGGAYATLLGVDQPPLDARATVVAAGLLVVAGLADWSVELRTTSPDEAGGLWRRPFWIALGGIGTLALGGVLLAVVDLTRTEGIVVEAIGTAAALTAVVLVARLAATQRADAD